MSPYQHYYDNNFAAHVRKELTYPFNPKKNDIYNNIAEPPSNLINPGCVQKIGAVHHERYAVIFESQKVLPCAL